MRRVGRVMKNERYHDLDFVRAAAMLLGIVLHICIFFLPPREFSWWSGEYRGDEVNLQFWNLIHLFRMQLFFLMAGFFAELVIHRKGLPNLVRDRAKRIGIPFAVGVLLMMPFHMAIVMGGLDGHHVGGFETERTLLERFQPFFLWGIFESKLENWVWPGLAHYWFLYYLILFYIVHFAIRPIWMAIGLDRFVRAGGFVDFVIRNRWGVLLIGGLCLPFQYLLPGMIFFPSGWNAPVLDLAFYLVFYLFGCVLYHRRDRVADLARHAWFYAALSIPFAFFIHDATSRIDDSAPVVRDITTWTIFEPSTGAFVLPQVHWEGIFHNGWYKIAVAGIRTTLCWTMCFAFIGFARRYLNTPRPVIRYLADSAYWVYWIHLPITFGLSYVAHEFAWPSSLARSYLVMVVSAVVIYWSYNTFVRYTWLGDFFMGSRRSRTDPDERDFRLTSLLRMTAPTALAIGGICFVLGFLLQYEREFQRSDVLVEAFATRDVAIIEGVESIDGITDGFGNTPLHAAIMNGGARNYDPLPLLIERTVEIDRRNEFGRTPLFDAVRSGMTNDVRTLLAAGADPDLADAYGHTPAHVAAIKAGTRDPSAADSYLGILRILMEGNADLDLRDARGRTAVECFEQFGGGDPGRITSSR